MNTKLDFAKRHIHHPLFDDQQEVEKILAYQLSEEDYDPRYPRSNDFDHPIIKREATYKLFLKYNLCKKLIAENKDYEQLRKETKSIILNHNIRLIFMSTKKFKEKDALLSTGFITLDKAVDRFDYTIGVAFNTYASTSIYMNCVREVYHSKELELAPEFAQYDVLSHYSEDKGFLDDDMSEFVNKHILHHVTEREREILERHYGLNGRDAETLEEIGRSWNDTNSVSKQRIRQIKDKAIKRLRVHCAKYSQVPCI
jgi:RNA polymerase sigma factor (sigma-70 family)